MTRVTFGKSRVRESRTPGSVRAKVKWLSYSTATPGSRRSGNGRWSSCGPANPSSPPRQARAARNLTVPTDLGPDHFDRVDRTRLATRLARKLDELGFDVTLSPRKAV